MESNFSLNLIKRLLNFSDRVVFVTPTQQITSLDFAREILSIAFNIHEKGLHPNSLVAIGDFGAIKTTAIQLALSLLGIPHTRFDERALLKTNTTPDYVFLQEKTDINISAKVYYIDNSWSFIPNDYLLNFLTTLSGFDNPQSIAAIFFSSGTTGTPKAIRFSAYLMAEIFSDCVELYSETRCSLVLPPPHSLIGYMLTFQALWRGTVVVFNTSDPLSVGVDHVFGSAGQVLGLCQKMPLNIEDKIPIVTVVGAAINRENRIKILKYFKSIRIKYGATEIGVHVAQHTIDQDSIDNASVGFISEKVNVEVVDELGCKVPDDNVGTIRIQRNLNRGVLGSLGDKTKCEWHYTGDIGFISANNTLTLKGRSDNVINIGGVKVSAEEVDEKILEIGNIAECAVFKYSPCDNRGNRLAVALVLSSQVEINDLFRKMAVAIGNSLGVNIIPNFVFLLSSLPRNENGKLQRFLISSIIQDHQGYELILSNKRFRGDNNVTIRLDIKHHLFSRSLSGASQPQ